MSHADVTVSTANHAAASRRAQTQAESPKSIAERAAHPRRTEPAAMTETETSAVMEPLIVADTDPVVAELPARLRKFTKHAKVSQIKVNFSETAWFVVETAIGRAGMTA